MPQMYNESQINWHMFPAGCFPRLMVHYCRPLNFPETAAVALGLTEDDAARRWCQLMYFFATLRVLAHGGALLPGNKPTEPPPKLAVLWEFFCKTQQASFIDYCKTFFEGQDIGWREQYTPEHELTPTRLRMVMRAAFDFGFVVDEDLWTL